MQRPVVEADDAPLVLGGALADRAGVGGPRDPPQRERLPGHPGVQPVEAALGGEAGGGDQQQRRRRDPRDQTRRRARAPRRRWSRRRTSGTRRYRRSSSAQSASAADRGAGTTPGSA